MRLLTRFTLSVSVTFMLSVASSTRAQESIVNVAYGTNAGKVVDEWLRPFFGIASVDSSVAEELITKTEPVTPFDHFAKDENRSSEDQIRMAKIAYCRSVFFRKHVDANELRPWSIMHGLIGSGSDAITLFDNQKHNAIEYLLQNGAGDGMQILELQNGQLAAKQGPGVQGHAGQLLAILAQSGATIDQEILVGGKTFSLKDLVEYEKKTCRSNTELTFKLLGLTYFLPSDTTWKNDLGENWSMERLLREEARETISSGACGGTHRLMALSHAVVNRLHSDVELDGEWLRADAIVQAYAARARQLQNPDGSYSTDFFDGRGNDPDMTRRLYTTGHVVEWLAFTLPADRLQDSSITAAVDYLLGAMLSAPNHDIDVGPRGHTLHALAMYEAKVYGANSNQMDWIAHWHRYEALQQQNPQAFQTQHPWGATPRSADRGNQDSTNNASRARRSSGVFRRR